MLKKVKSLCVELTDIDSMEKVVVNISDSIVKESNNEPCTSIRINMEVEDIVFDLDDEGLDLLIDALMIRSHNKNG